MAPYRTREPESELVLEPGVPRLEGAHGHLLDAVPAYQTFAQLVKICSQRGV